MKRLTIALAVGALAVLAVATAVAAAGPRTQAREQAQTQTQTTLTEILGLSNDQIAELRHDGMTLAQIAERQGVDEQELIDALGAQWTVRINARVANGALTEDQGTALRTQVELKAKAMVNQATYGGMRGAAVGAGPSANGNASNGNGSGYRAGNGSGNAERGGNGNGSCDGTGPNGTGRNGASS